MAKIYVLHENPEWVVPLEGAFREQELPYELWFLDQGSVDLAAPPPDGVFYNRMSASSHTRDHRLRPNLRMSFSTGWNDTAGESSTPAARSIWRSARSRNT